MKNKENEKYVKVGLTAVSVLCVSLICFFIFFKASALLEWFRGVIRTLAPIILGALLAYLLAPACNKLEGLLNRMFSKEKRRDKLCSTLAIVISLLVVFMVLWALVMMISPQLGQSVIELAVSLPGQIENTIKWGNELLSSRPELQELFNTVLTEAEARLKEWMRTELMPTAQNLLNGVGGGILSVVNVLKNILIGFIVSAYLLGSRKRLAVQSRMALYGIFPNKWAKKIEDEVRYADRMFSGFLVGKLIDSLIVGILCFIGVSVLSLPSTLLISAIIGITNIIPFFGPIIGAVPCALLLLLENPWHCLYFVIFIIILQQLDGNVIGPKILSGSTGLSGFWVLFAILLFGGLWGFVGMIVAVPLFAVIYDIARKTVRLGLKKHGAYEMFDITEEAAAVPPAGEEAPAEEAQPRA